MQGKPDPGRILPGQDLQPVAQLLQEGRGGHGRRRPISAAAEVSDGESRPALVYAADGSAEPFKVDPGLLDAEVGVVECSFLEANRRVAATLSKHAHLKDWIELARWLTCDTLVLAHLPEIGAAEASTLLAPLERAFPGRLVAWLPRE
jgi:ribonuclease BN (tRNA processing enzyme)